MIMKDFNIDESNKQFKWIPRAQAIIVMTLLLLVGIAFFKIKAIPKSVQSVLAIAMWLLSLAIYPAYMIKVNKEFRGNIVDTLATLLCTAVPILIAIFVYKPGLLEIGDLFKEGLFTYFEYVYLIASSILILITGIIGMFGEDK